MGRPKKNPEELKQIIAISLTRAEIDALDANIEAIRVNLANAYNLTDEQRKAWNSTFNRSAIIREFIGLMSSKAGYSLLIGSMMQALDSLGFSPANETRSFLDG